MWIKAIFCTEDIIYAERLAQFLDKEYGSKIELNLCSSMEALWGYLDQNVVDIALFGDEYEKELQSRIKDIPCICVMIRDQIYEHDNCGLHQIYKYQKGTQIYQNIFDLYASGEKVKRIQSTATKNDLQKIYVFTSAGGGSGTSTVARAFAQKCAAYEKVLYLDMGLFNCIETVEGNANGMDEIIFAMKSRRNILPLKLVSAVSTMADGIFTYGPCSDLCNMLELNQKDIQNLLHGVSALSEYQKIIVDIGTSISYREVEVFRQADAIIYIIDESDIGKKKYEKFYNFMENLSKKEHQRFSKKILIFRNKVRGNYSAASSIFHNRIIGWAPFVSINAYDLVVSRIAQSDSFHDLEIVDE